MTASSIKDFDLRVKKAFSECARPNLSPSAHNDALASLRELEDLANPLGFAEEIRKVGEYYLQRQRMKDLGRRVDFPIEYILKFARQGLGATFQFAVTDSPEAFASIPIETLMKATGSPALLDKIGKDRKDLLADAVAFFQAYPGSSSECPGFLWVVNKAKIEQLFPFLSEICANAGASTGNTLLTTLLTRDKSGKAIAELMVLVGNGEISTETLVEGLRRCPTAAVTFLHILPKLATRKFADRAIEVLIGWLSHLNEIPYSERRMVSGALAVVIGGLLQKKRLKPPEVSIFQGIEQATERLSIQIGSDRAGFWTFLPVSGETQLDSGGFWVSPEGARLLVESLLKLESGRYQATDVIEALALNLGLSRHGQAGTRVNFDPNQHEDSAGGLLRGQPAEVVRPGWNFQGATILKAKVNPRRPHA